MPGLSHIVPFGLLAAVLLPLAGCDTFGMNFGSSAPSAPAQRAIDYRNDDLSSMVFALDLPANLQPVPSRSILTFDATTAANAGKHVKAALTLVDGDAAEGKLPPPATGRTYYLLGPGTKDKAALTAAQTWLKALPPDAAPVTVLQVVPSFCSSGPVDPTTATISILPALPTGDALAPLVETEPLSNLLADSAGKLPVCGRK